jgi:hypothetical protein
MSPPLSGFRRDAHKNSRPDKRRDHRRGTAYTESWSGPAVDPAARAARKRTNLTKTGKRGVLDLRIARPHNVAGGERIVPLSIGILIIGSLYWEQDDVRLAWRERLRMEDAVDVDAPIRYGRISENRGNTYTMVFARGCPPGRAKAVPCLNAASTAEELITEAEHLWAAECRAPMNGRISANWGCVALTANPQRAIHAEILAGWAARVRRARPYGNIRQAPGEGVGQNFPAISIFIYENQERFRRSATFSVDDLSGNHTVFFAQRHFDRC